MDSLLYFIARSVIGLVLLLPLDAVARLGRFVGGLLHFVDARHRRVAVRNMTMCFGSEKSPEEIKLLVRENFRRIGENFGCAIKTSSMSDEEMGKRLTFVGVEKMLTRIAMTPEKSVIVAIGHFGNFEVFARASKDLPSHKPATTYRAFRPPSIDRLFLKLRQTTGALYFERRNEGGAMRNALRSQKIILGLLSDQHSGDHGVRIPFLGHDCNTTKAPAVFAARFDLPFFASVCFRTKLAHWTIQVSDEIPTQENGQPRSIEAMMLDVNRFFESAVRRDPANWFWVHNRWKDKKIKGSPQKKNDDSENGASGVDGEQDDPLPEAPAPGK